MPRRIISCFLSTEALSVRVTFTWSPLGSIKLVRIQNIFDSKGSHWMPRLLSRVVFTSREILRVFRIAAQAATTPVINKRVDRKPVTTLHPVRYCWVFIVKCGGLLNVPFTESARGRSYETFGSPIGGGLNSVSSYTRVMRGGTIEVTVGGRACFDCCVHA